LVGALVAASSPMHNRMPSLNKTLVPRGTLTAKAASFLNMAEAHSCHLANLACSVEYCDGNASMAS